MEGKMSGKGAKREDVLRYVQEQYGTIGERLWEKFPDYIVLRNNRNGKWYGIIMDIERKKLGLKGEGKVDMMNVKCSYETKEMFLFRKGFVPAYHMNRENWLGILLDGTADKKAVEALLDESKELSETKMSRRMENRAFLVPANPKYYDVVGAFEKEEEILWKQNGDMLTGDIVFLYVAAPYSAVLYKCKVVETNIPYEYADENLKMDKVMKIRREKTYGKDEFPLEKLKEHGVFYIRGKRNVPYSLLSELNAAISPK